MRARPPRWPGADEPLPAIKLEVPSGDSLHRVAARNALQILLDAGMGMAPPVALLRWAWCVQRCSLRVPQA